MKRFSFNLFDSAPRVLPVVVVLLIASLTGCSYFKELFSSEKDVEPVEVLVQNGVEAFEEE